MDNPSMQWAEAMSWGVHREFAYSVRLLRLLQRVEGKVPLNADERRLKEFLEARPKVARAAEAKRFKWGWKPAELRKIDRFILTRARIGNGKPFRRNDEVRDLAAYLGRTEDSVYKMIQRRRKQLRKCPSATGQTEA